MTVSWEEYAGEDPRTGEQDPEQRYRLYRLCECPRCRGTGKGKTSGGKGKFVIRCTECRGEGKVRELVATCATPGDIGEAIVRLGAEGEFEDCPLGLLDCLGETGKKWIVRPWLASTRNRSDAARLMANARWEKAGKR